MLETVSRGFLAAKNLLKGQAQLNEGNISDALRQVRLSLLEADVAFDVVQGFLGRVQEKALGKTVATKKVSPSDHFVGVCYKELEALMGPVDTSLKFSQPVGTIMMVGLQGSGKTTHTGKLALFLKSKKMRPLLVAADIYRPAAVDQLKTLGAQLDVPVYSEPGVAPPDLCKRAIQKAKEHQCNVVIFDTAGRLAIDDQLMRELEEIKSLTKPDNTLLVVDSMIGQDAVKTAAEFNRRIGIDGFILTKLDGDARGGAALSIKEVTGRPIKFLGMGEKMQNLEEFRPQGLASRILGMGDIVGLVQDFEAHVEQEKAEEDAKRMLKGQFTLQDFLEQLRLIKKMGSFSSLLEKLPGMGEMMPQGAQVDDREFVKFEAMVLSMTAKERAKPELISAQKSRRQRIARGSGRAESEVDGLIKRFTMMRQMMQMVGAQPSLLGRMPGFKQMAQAAQMSNLGGMNPFGMAAPAVGSHPHPALSRQRERDKTKRKAQKLARKKNKKKK